mgnify:FL=1
MRFFLDENIPLSVLDFIASFGFKVDHVKNIGMHGARDKQIAEYAKKQKAVLITKDLEFGNLLIYPSGSHYGLLILKLPYTFSADQIAKTLSDFLTKIDTKDLANSITVLEIGRYRIRHLK